MEDNQVKKVICDIVRKGRTFREQNKKIEQNVEEQSDKKISFVGIKAVRKKRETVVVKETDKRKNCNKEKNLKLNEIYLNSPIVFLVLHYDKISETFKVKKYSSEKSFSVDIKFICESNCRGYNVDPFRIRTYIANYSEGLCGKHIQDINEETHSDLIFYAKDSNNLVNETCKKYQENQPVYPRRAGQLSLSCLQKLVRREKINEAMASAKALILNDFISFIRRLMIIIPEDAPMLPNYSRPLPKLYSVLAWLLVTENVFRPSVFLCSWLLDVVRVISDPNSTDIRNVNQRNIIKLSAEIRASWGGKKDDLRMIGKSYGVWKIKATPYTNINIKKDTDTKADNKEHIGSKKKILLWDTVTPLKIIEFPEYSVDFHCFRQILEKSIQEGPSPPTADIDNLKRCMWVCRSSICHKQGMKIVSDKFTRIYADYATIFDKISKLYIKWMSTLPIN